MINKRARQARLVINKLIIIILAILVLLALLMFIYKVDILGWLRNLPEYTYDEDEEIDYTKLSPDRLALFRCTEKIAILGDKDVTSFWKDRGFEDVRELFMLPEKRKVNLHVVAKKSDYFLIKVADANVEVGEIKEKILAVKENIIKNYDSHEVGEHGVSLTDLRMLDEARLLGRLLCKTKEEVGKVPVIKKVLGMDREVFLSDSEGRCRVDLGYIGTYGLKDGQLEYLENEEWKNVEDEIPNEEQIGLRGKKDELVDKKNNLKIKYVTENTLLLDSKEGVYFVDRGTTYLYYPDYNLNTFLVKKISSSGEFPALELKEDFEKALNNANLMLKNYGDEENPYYVLAEVSIPVLITPDAFSDSYALDDVNTFYLLKTDQRKWKKFEKDEYEYLYVDKEYWEHMKQRAKIKQDLIKACKK